MKNTRLLCYNTKVRPRVVGVMRWVDYKDRVSLGVVASNMLACLRKNSKLVYSRRKGEKLVGRNPKNLTVNKIIKAVDKLEKMGYLINHIGTGSAIRDEREISYVIPTKKFIEKFEVEDHLLAEIDHLENCSVVEMRDEGKKMINYKLTDKVEDMIESVRKLNTVNEMCDIRDSEGQQLTNIYCRIFNQSFDMGGRFYRADVLGIKNKGTNDRLKITMDGQPVCEVDYANLHFRIAAAYYSMLEESIPLDVYSELLEDPDNKVERNIVKVAVNIMFNSTSVVSARGAIQKEINKLTPEQKSVYTLGGAKSVMALINNSYPEFESLFCDSEGFGLRLQNMDSHLASSVVDVFVEMEAPCLIIHDSFIVQQKHLDLLCNTMGDKFKELFDWEGVVPLGIKYFTEDGELIDEKIVV